MTTGYNIPLDLIIEILLRLPGKSVLRFKSVSKSWLSIISSQQFINAFMSRSRLILNFSDYTKGRVLFLSIPHQSCSFFEESSMLVAEKNTVAMSKSKTSIDYVCNSVRGFLCCKTMDGFVVCNPTTGQVIPLVEDKYYNYILRYFCLWYLGYDPNNDQYKVLRIIDGPKVSSSRIQHSVCTLGGQGSSHSWRPIKTSILYHSCYQNGVCIDGVVYHKYKSIEDHPMIGSFDVGSEQLHLITTPKDLKGNLTNYLGKLAVCLDNENGFNLWVLDDVKNQVWSMKTYVVPSFTELSTVERFSFAGITASGEIVYVLHLLSFPLEFLCFDVEKMTERRVRVKGLEDYVYEFDNNCTTLFDQNKKNCSTLGPYYVSQFHSYVENITYL